MSLSNKRSIPRKRVAIVMAILIGLCQLGCLPIDYKKFMLKKKAPSADGTEIPKIIIDKNASIMILAFDECQAKRYERMEILSALEEYWNQSATIEDAVPARVKIEGEIVDEYAWLILDLGLFSIFGFPVTSSTAEISIVIETADGSHYKGKGRDGCLDSLYYPGDSAQCSLAYALAGAIREAVR